MVKKGIGDISEGQPPIEISDSERKKISEKLKKLQARIVKEEIDSTLKKTGHDETGQLYNLSLKKQRIND